MKFHAAGQIADFPHHDQMSIYPPKEAEICLESSDGWVSPLHKEEEEVTWEVANQ